MTNRNVSKALAGLAFVGLSGCQAYRSAPLDLDKHAHEWSRRSLEADGIRAYAERLMESDSKRGGFDSADGLTLHEAEAVALHFNPQLRMARANAEVPLASAKQVGWWPDPQFEAEVLRFVNRGSRTKFQLNGPSLDGVNTGLLGTGSATGLEATPPGFRRVNGDFVDDPWIVGASISFTIPVSGRLAVEKDLRWSEYSSAWRNILVAEWDLLTRLRNAWLNWSTTKERLTVTGEYVLQLGDVSEMAQQLSTAGEMRPTESRVLVIELARQRAKLQMLEGTEERERLKILSLLGLTPDTPATLVPDVFLTRVAGEPDERTTKALQRHPRIQAARAAYEVAEQNLKHECRLQYPDLQLGPSYSFEEGFSRMGMGFGFPLPLWNRNRQAIAEAAAQREAARIRAEVEVESALADLREVESQLNYATRQRNFLINEVAPLVGMQLEDSRTLMDLGEVDVLLLRDALTSSLETKLEVLSAMLAEARASNTLSQMVEPRWFTPSRAEEDASGKGVEE